MAPEPPPAAPMRPSLAGRAAGALGRLRRQSERGSATEADASPAARTGPAYAIAAAMVFVPASLWIGATLLASGVRADLDRMEVRVDEANAARDGRAAARALLAAAWEQPALSATIESVARALPADAQLLRVERRDGALSLDVAAPDADRVAAALRRDPALARLRATGQRTGRDGIEITLAEDR